MVYFGKNRFGISKVSAGLGPVVVTSAGNRFKGKRMALMSKPSLGKEIKNVKKNIKEMKNKEELKWYDTFPLNATAILNQSSPTFNVLNAMLQGDLGNNREGDSVSATSFQFRCKITGNPTAGAEVVRHIVVWDSQANQALPTVGQILDLSVATIGVYAPYNHTFQKRFKILFDRTYTINEAITAVGYSISDQAKIKLSRTTKYASSAAIGGIADINTNSLISLWVSDQASAGPAVTCAYRFYFKDD